MIILAILFAMIAFFFVFLSGHSENQNNRDFAFVFAAVSLSISCFIWFELGAGKLNYRSLNKGEVREVVCTAPASASKESGARIGALLRKPNGELEARILLKEPPKKFVVIDDKDNPYIPYLPEMKTSPNDPYPGH